MKHERMKEKITIRWSRVYTTQLTQFSTTVNRKILAFLSHLQTVLEGDAYEIEYLRIC